MEIETAFNGITSETFAAHSETVRGHVRYELVKRNLGALVASGELAIADIGGGAAIDATWLAQLGHQVTVIDPAEDQLAAAAKKLSECTAAVRQRITLKQGTIEDALINESHASYDLVLSHGVAMYLEDPEIFIGKLAQAVKPGGYVSLLEKGFYGARNGLIHEGQYEAAASLDSSGKMINHQNREVWAFKPESLYEYLKHAGAESIHWSGVRVTRDFDARQSSEVPGDELQRIVDEEFAAGKRDDLRAAAPMLHFIAKMRTV